MAHGYYKLQGDWVGTSTLAEATAAWREERGYDPIGVFDTPAGIVDTTNEQVSAPAAPTSAPAVPSPPADDPYLQNLDQLGIDLPNQGTTQTSYDVQSIQSIGFQPTFPSTTQQQLQTGFPELDQGWYSQQGAGDAALAAAQQAWQLPATDIDQRQYNLPQFGDSSGAAASGLGIDGTLNQQQLAYAASLTGTAMFVYGQLPDVISTQVAAELPFNPTSGLFQNVMQEAFGVDGFDTPDEWLTALGYYEYAPGQWEILDPVTVTGYGDGYYQGGGVSPSSGPGSSAARGSGYSQGGSLVNWRIGF